MRFMMLMIPGGYEKAEPGTLPEANRVEKMMWYNRDLQEAGILVSCDGLHPHSMGTRAGSGNGRFSGRRAGRRGRLQGHAVGLIRPGCGHQFQESRQ